MKLASLMLIVLWFLTTFIDLGLSQEVYEPTDAQAFFDSCKKNALAPVCSSYECYSKYHHLDLRLLDKIPCSRSKDCMYSSTGFICIKYEGGRGFCECPQHMAYNSTSCQCQKAKLCPRFEAESTTNPARQCHNGMECRDDRCSCQDLDQTLFEPQGRFCVLPRGPDDPDESELAAGDHNKAFWIVLIVIAVLVALGLVAILIYIFSERIECNKGDYECETDDKPDTNSNNYIATWDMPSMDYLSEEQTMKYLRTHHQNNLAFTADENTSELTEASTQRAGSSTPDNNGSLPESDRPRPVNESRTEHDNQAFVETEDADEIRRTSECHDL